MINFSEMGFSETILDNLKNEGYETPTAIQEQAIPVLLTVTLAPHCSRAM